VHLSHLFQLKIVQVVQGQIIIKLITNIGPVYMYDVNDDIVSVQDDQKLSLLPVLSTI